MSSGFSAAFDNPLPIFHPQGLIVGAIGAGLIALALNMKKANAKKYRKGAEYGSARFGTPADIKPYIVHFRCLFEGARSDNEYQNLISVRPQYRDGIAKMILLDFITRQDDRHLSNIAIEMTESGEIFYPLYDNGRSLFYEDTEEMVRQAVTDPVKYATSFGYSGAYCQRRIEIVDFRRLNFAGFQRYGDAEISCRPAQTAC